jgi:flagellar basal body-associated protein FliL
MNNKLLILVIFNCFNLTNLNFSYAQESKSEELILKDSIDLKDLFLPINQNINNNFSNYVRMSMNIKLANAADYPSVNDKLSNITDSIKGYFKTVSKDDFAGSNGLFELKQNITHVINQITSPVKIQKLYISDITVQ